MNHILRECGIRNRLTTPYTPQQNGVSERKNRTLIELARCILLESGLPQSFWGESVSTACYLRNGCLTKILNIKTPFEMLTGKRPDVRHLRRFGTKVYFLNSSPNKDKLKPKGVEGIFVGYSTTAKAYRVYDPVEKKIRITRDLRFMDEFSPSGVQEKSTVAPEVEFFLDQKANPDVDLQVNNDPVINVPVDEVIPRDENIEKRGAGRPKIIRTGRRGRPAKEYNIVREGDNPEPLEPRESDFSNESSEEEFYGRDLDDNAMTACEISMRDALSGPDCQE